jgi:hypothetical protein
LIVVVKFSKSHSGIFAGIFKIESVDWRLQGMNSNFWHRIGASIVCIPFVAGEGKGCAPVLIIVGNECFLRRDWIATSESYEEI